MKATLPPDEAARLATLVSCGILDTDPDPELDELVRLAGRICEAPIALISLVDRERQWFKSRLGISVRETPRDIAFCAHAILGDEPLVVPDARLDPRFADNPLVVAEPSIRFYAGAPLRLAGHAIGTLCVLDIRPRAPDEGQLEALRVLSRQIVARIELRVTREHEARLMRESELARARRDRHEGEQRLRAVIDQLPAAVWTVDRDLRFAWALGQRSPEVDRQIGRPYAELFADGAATEPVAAHAAALRGETRAYEADWRGRAYHCHVQPLRDDAGRIVGAVGVSLDVTDERHLRDELEQARKMESIGRLAGGVAHDFNNILTVIVGYAELALRSLPAADPACARLQGIREAARRAAALTRQLLAFSRKQVLHPRSLSLAAVTRALAPMLARLLGEDVRVSLELAERLPTVRADPAQLEQVLMNLVANARDAMPRGGHLRIATRAAPAPAPGALPDRPACAHGWVELRVADDGMGMDEETRARVFEPFFTTKEPGKGTGLGLAMVFGIVAQSGGAVAVDSRPGEGTAVAIWLPAVPEEPGEGEPAEAAAPAAAGIGRVLVVEDDDTVRALAVEALEGGGYEVIAARDAAEARRLAEQRAGALDLVVTDIVMPGMNGIELARVLAERWPGLRVLYTSGYSEAALARYGVLPEDALLSKPYTLDQLVAQAGRALAS